MTTLNTRRPTDLATKQPAQLIQAPVIDGEIVPNRRRTSDAFLHVLILLILAAGFGGLIVSLNHP